MAVAERGVCPLAEKIANVHGAGGYSGVIIFSWESNTVLPDGTLVRPESSCTTVVDLSITGSIPALFVGRHTGLSFFDVPYDEAACLDTTPQLAPMAIGTRGDRVDVKRVFDGWGYVRLFRNGPGKLAELDTYAIPQAHNPAYASGYGTLSVHEVAMSERRNDLAYLSYYAGGLRVLRIQNDRLVEVGHFIDQGGNNFWGVQVWQKDGKEYILASDRDYGLYIFEYTGSGSPNTP
jgi:hypothetical protein